MLCWGLKPGRCAFQAGIPPSEPHTQAILLFVMLMAPFNSSPTARKGPSVFISLTLILTLKNFQCLGDRVWRISVSSRPACLCSEFQDSQGYIVRPCLKQKLCIFVAGQMVAHVFNPSTWKAEAGESLSLRPAWSTERVPGQPGQHREILSRPSKRVL